MLRVTIIVRAIRAIREIRAISELETLNPIGQLLSGEWELVHSSTIRGEADNPKPTHTKTTNQEPRRLQRTTRRREEEEGRRSRDLTDIRFELNLPGPTRGAGLLSIVRPSLMQNTSANSNWSFMVSSTVDCTGFPLLSASATNPKSRLRCIAFIPSLSFPIALMRR